MEFVSMLAANALLAAGTTINPMAVVGLGMGIVFFGLICIIFLTKIMGMILGAGSKEKKEVPAAAPVVAPAPVQTAIANRGEFIAAVSAAIAEDLGEDVSKIRIVSVRQL